MSTEDNSYNKPKGLAEYMHTVVEDKKTAEQLNSLSPLVKIVEQVAELTKSFFDKNAYHFYVEDLLKPYSEPYIEVINTRGWVYIFAGLDENNDLSYYYVGETGRQLHERIEEHKDESKKKDIRKCWYRVSSRIAAIPCENKRDRKLIEGLIGYQTSSQGNRLQPPSEDEFLTSTIMVLSRMKGASPINEDISDSLEYLKFIFDTTS